MATFEITGTITGSDGSKTEFVFHSGIGSWSQWGENRARLFQRVPYLDAMEKGLTEHSDYYSQTEDDE